MPASTDAARLVRDGGTLRFTGALARTEVARLWRQAQAAPGGEVRVLDLAGVTVVDSAGLALLAELAGHGDARIEGVPPGFHELRSAYRLNPQLGFSIP